VKGGTQEKPLGNDERIETRLVKWQHYCKRHPIEYSGCEEYVLLKVKMCDNVKVTIRKVQVR